MLEAFIIDEMRRQERQDEPRRTYLEIPMPRYQPPHEHAHREPPTRDRSDDDEDRDNGVIILDM